MIISMRSSAAHTRPPLLHERRENARRKHAREPRPRQGLARASLRMPNCRLRSLSTARQVSAPAIARDACRRTLSKFCVWRVCLSLRASSHILLSACVVQGVHSINTRSNLSIQRSKQAHSTAGSTPSPSGSSGGWTKRMPGKVCAPRAAVREQMRGEHMLF